jgi:murein L,D-transpeptidase YcbB/YkuD
VAQGRVAPDQIYRPWLARRRPITRDIPYELAQAVKNDDLESFLASLHPRSIAYQRLLGALGWYENIRRSGGWFAIDPGPTLRHGDEGPRVAMLKQRLQLTGDGFDAAPIENDRFDERTTAAVKQFQRRLGLNDDGLVGKETLTALNVPVAQRIRQLQLNMERWRWFPDSFGDRYLMVNIPAYTLTLVDSGKATHVMRVIVGKQDRQTPIMSDSMTYLEFNPYWNIPQGIARKDILPKIKHDPFYLIRQGIRVFDTWDPDAQELDPTRIAWDDLSTRRFPYRLRQDPSHHNALGQVKFIFPNPHSIYIHDTPGKALFNHRLRSFSSGCVRIEEPITLAHLLLKDQGWGRHELDAVIAGEKNQSVILETPMPVHLVYFTAWVDENGTVNFRKDIYGRDARLFQALQHKAPDLIAHAPRPGNANLL